MLESRERINMACDHLKNVEEQPARIFHSYIRQLKKKEISYPNLWSVAENYKLISMRLNN